MTDINLILVATPEDIRQSLATFNAEAKHFLRLARSLLRDTTYWIHDADTQLFGPAKFVGFAGMSLAKYQEARNHHYTGARFDGNVTRRAIESALQTSFAYDQHLTSKLRAWGKSL